MKYIIDDKVTINVFIQLICVIVFLSYERLIRSIYIYFINNNIINSIIISMWNSFKFKYNL